MRIKVTDNYTIDLPSDIREEIDNPVTSYWTGSDALVLQLSSYTGIGALEYDARDRLMNHLSKKGQVNFDSIELNVHSLDFAGCLFVDEKDWKWLFSYLLWADLVILATVVSTEGVEILGSWATEAIESIERTE